MDVQVSLGWFALAGTTIALASPILMSILTNRNALALKEQDWARQDEVADKAEKAAARNASLIAELNQSNSETAKVTIGKLDVIHTLVNSTLTASMQVALDGVRRELALMERDTTTDPALIDSTKTKIGELQTIIDERNKQTDIANLQDQQAEARRASAAVGIISPQHTTAPQALGEVTDRVLRGEPAPLAGANHGVVEKTAAQTKAAVETVAAADKTVKAAAATVEAMKGTKPT